MSIRVMSDVWQHAKDVRGSTLIVFLALADWSNEEGESWPSVDVLADKARVGRRTVQIAVKELVDLGYIEVEERRGRNHTNVYVINVQKLHGAEYDMENVQNTTQNVQNAAQNVSYSAPNTSRYVKDTSIEPSNIKEAAPKKKKKSPATSLPDDFVVTDHMREWAAKTLPGLDVDNATEAWLDGMRSNTTKYRYSNWVAAWRSGMRKHNEWFGRRNGNGRQGQQRGPGDDNAQANNGRRPLTRTEQARREAWLTEFGIDIDKTFGGGDGAAH